MLNVQKTFLKIFSQADSISIKCSFLPFCYITVDEWKEYWKLWSNNLLWWYFFDFKGNFWIQSRAVYHLELQYRAHSILVKIHCVPDVPLHIFVIFDFQLQILSDVAVSSRQFQLGFVLMTKLQFFLQF